MAICLHLVLTALLLFLQMHPLQLLVFLCVPVSLIYIPLSTADENTPALDKGLVFLKKDTILLTSSSWMVTIDVDLNSHAQAITNFIEKVDNFNPISTLNAHANTTDPDENVILFLEKESRYMKRSALRMLGDIHSINMTIHGMSTRKRGKRGLIDGGGEIMQFLFGTLTTRDFNKINARINNISMATNEMTHIVKDQLTVISKSYSQLNEQAAKFRKLETLTKFLEQDFFHYQKNMATEIDKVNYRITYLSKVLQLSRSMMDSHEALYHTTQQLKTAFLYASQSTLDPFFLPYTQFMEITKDIQLHLPHGQEILSYNHDGNFQITYNILKMSVFEFNGMLRIFVEFPIYRHDKTFTVYEVLPLPTKIKNSDLFYSIIPETQYFAISINFDYYFDLSVADLQECAKHSIPICSPTKALRKANFNNCLYSLFTGKSFNIEKICTIKTFKNFDPIFHRPTNSHDYIYSIAGSTPIHSSCDYNKNKSSIPDILTGNGILSIPHSCNVVGQDFILFGNNPLHESSFTIKNNIQMPKTFTFPSIHKIQNLNLTLSTAKYDELNSLFTDATNSNSTPVDLSTLLQRLDDLQTGTTIFGFDELSYYLKMTIYFCLFIIAVCAVFLYGRKKCQKSIYTLPLPRPHQPALYLQPQVYAPPVPQNNQQVALSPNLTASVTL
jgi:hypothetical protein